MSAGGADQVACSSVEALAKARQMAACGYGMIGAGLAIVVLLVLHLLLFVAAARAAAGVRPVTWFDIFVTGDDNRYSLSRFQMWLWTVVVVIGFTALSFATGKFAAVPQNPLLLMGLNGVSAVASTAINTRKTPAGAVDPGSPANVWPPPPRTGPAARRALAPASFVRDIFFNPSVPGDLDLPRTQMFVWTVLLLLTWVVLFLKSFPKFDSNGLPGIPGELVGLMGVSQGAYLGMKAVGEKADKPAPGSGTASVVMDAAARRAAESKL